jgi:hypothetical protein
MELFAIALVVGLILIVAPLVVEAVVPRIVTAVTPIVADGAAEGREPRGETPARDTESGA